MEGMGVGLGHEAITISTVALAFTTLPALANAALVRTEANSIRFSTDSTAPTASVGILLTASDTAPFWIAGRGSLVNFKAIRSGIADGTLQVSYYAI